MTDNELEDLAFLYTNSPALPIGARDFIRELWARYCAATTPLEPGLERNFKELSAALIKREPTLTKLPLPPRSHLRLVGTFPDHPDGCP